MVQGGMSQAVLGGTVTQRLSQFARKLSSEHCPCRFSVALLIKALSDKLLREKQTGQQNCQSLFCMPGCLLHVTITLAHKLPHKANIVTACLTHNILTL